MLAGAGTEAYDRMTFHEMPFDSPAVRAAFLRLGRILFTEGYVYGGPEVARETSFWEAVDPMFMNEPPGCWLNQGASFMAGAFRPPRSVGSEFSAFAFPALTDDSDPHVLGGGDMIAAFEDRPEVRELVRFLLGATYGSQLAGGGRGWISANRHFDLGNYPPLEREQAELVEAALAADTFRFDASDLMPIEIGEGAFWRAMMTYLAKGPESLDRILADLDAAWPEG